jgi:hypothetical protein
VLDWIGVVYVWTLNDISATVQWLFSIPVWLILVFSHIPFPAPELRCNVWTEAPRFKVQFLSKVIDAVKRNCLVDTQPTHTYISECSGYKECSPTYTPPKCTLVMQDINIRSFWRIIMWGTKVHGWEPNCIISIRHFTVMTSTTSTYKDARFVEQSNVIIHCIVVITTRTGEERMSPVSKLL